MRGRYTIEHNHLYGSTCGITVCFGQERTRRLTQQAEEDAKKITYLLDNKKIDLIVSSSYIRAIQTIEGIANAKSLKVELYEELRERQLKGAYRLSGKEIKQAIKKSYEHLDYKLPGENQLQMFEIVLYPSSKIF